MSVADGGAVNCQVTYFYNRTPTKGVRGHEVWSEQAITFAAIVWPRASSELTQGQDVVETGLMLWILPSVGITPTALDECLIAGKGEKRWQVQGTPGDYTKTPLSNTPGGWQVQLQQVS